jgi:hypothetical protein
MKAVGLGLGLAIGAGLVYLFAVNETAWIIFLALAMFILGGVVMALALLFLNRQWTAAVFGGGQPPRINNHIRMPALPLYGGQPQQQPGYWVEPYDRFQVVEGQGQSALNDDSPMA